MLMQDKVAIVTGAASGIDRGIVLVIHLDGVFPTTNPFTGQSRIVSHGWCLK